jgi:hypothetical protein
MLSRGKFCLLMRVFCVTKHLGIRTSQENSKMEAEGSSKCWHLSTQRHTQEYRNLIQEALPKIQKVRIKCIFVLM